ncbi:MAG: GNAT family N-acetyltransferase [Treponema sp.]|nr:GNAT family N-acetyltransferase [Treponema sp.]
MICDFFKKNLVIESPRLILRPISKKDVGDLFQIYSDTEMMQNRALLPFKTIEEAQNLADFFIRGMKEKTMLRWGMELKENGQLIGTCGFTSFSEQDRKAELEFEMIGKPNKGRGLMRETILVLLNFAFTNTDINRVEALIETQDMKAPELLKKVGFKKEGDLREYKMRRGKLTDMTLWAMLRSDFPL